MRQLTLPAIQSHAKSEDTIVSATPAGDANAEVSGLGEALLSLEQRRAKRREALAKMRDLWNNSQAGTDRIEGEDGVAYQKRLRAEW